MKRQSKWWMCGLGLLLPMLSIAPVGAQQPATPPSAGSMPTKGADSLSAGDHKFVEEAGTSNLAELKVAKLALDRGSSTQVKDLAQQLIDDHTKAGDQLKQIADEQGFSLPSEPTAKQKAIYDHLARLSGSAFDQAFLKQMKTDHQNAVSLFQRESTSAQDPQLRSFASETLPTLEHHKQMVQRQMHQM
jgi:putative membrane protein